MYLRSFQYKIINNILFLNEKLFVFGLSTTLSCSFCNSFGENITNLFCDCTMAQCLWKKLQLKLKDDTTGCDLRSPGSRLPILLNRKLHSSLSKTVHIKVQKNKISK